jgi:hypothetical protein
MVLALILFNIAVRLLFTPENVERFGEVVPPWQPVQLDVSNAFPVAV